MARPRETTETLKARGSHDHLRARERADRAATATKKVRECGPWRKRTERQLHALIRELPGYDPFALAQGYTFQSDLANEALAFFPKKLNHIEGAVAGRPFILERWQQSLVANLFGWVKWSPRWQRWVRRYRECLLYVPRKNGKTPLIAGLGLYVLLRDVETGQQNYLAAHTREQAGFLFRYAKGMLRHNTDFEEECRVYGGTASAGQSKSIVKLPDETSFLQVIASEANAQHGGTPHLLIVEELHTQPNRDLIDTLGTSMASENRAQPLLIMVTTADFERPSICNEKHDYACKVRDGVIPDPTFLPVIYEAQRSEDWTDEAVWRRVNPNLKVSVSLDYLRRECVKAKEQPALENVFRRLHLNQRTETDVRAVPMDRWDTCAEVPLQLADLAGRECFGGLDLSTTTDLTAFVLVFPLDDGSVAVLPWLWLPGETARIRSKSDRVPYELWARQGLIELTQGNVIDYDVVRKRINEISQRYFIRAVGRDRWNATQITTQLMGDGINMVDFGQGFASMTAPTKELLRLVTDGKLRHGGHPVLRWMASNLATESDAAGNLKPSKNKSSERIDGIVAMIMSLGMAMAAPLESAYEAKGLEVF